MLGRRSPSQVESLSHSRQNYMKLCRDIAGIKRVDVADSKGCVAELPPAVRSLIGAHTGDAVFVVGPDYRIVYWDPRAESLTGLLSEETVGRRCYEVVLGEREGGNPFCTYG